MSSNGNADEKVPDVPSSASGLDSHSAQLSSSEDLALIALEQRVLRKTDMVVLPMVRSSH
jgi:hypothetical protein